MADKATLKLPDIFRKLLADRGIVGDTAVSAFLHPRLENLPDPKKMKNLTAASNLIADYLIAKKRIIVWGDYDVDGTTAAALLINFFREYGVEVDYHIPNRLKEGYGINFEWFLDFEIGNSGKNFLLISVDCGSSDHAVIRKIKEIGGDVIVTDHHELTSKTIPDCIVVNPSQKDCGFNNYNLAGVGVAFYLAAGIKRELQLRDNGEWSDMDVKLKKYLCFVALGTVADIVEITEVNRILIRGGIEAIENTEFVGVNALLESCGLYTKKINSEDIGFLLGPKINAAGRLGKPLTVLKLFIENDKNKAKKLAEKLSLLNEERKIILSQSLELILTKINISQILHDKCVSVVSEIHPGVAGIVASKISDTHGVPTIIFSKKKLISDDSILYTGSGRSVEGVNLMKILNFCSEHIEYFGGHEMAAGLTVSADNFAKFKVKFIKSAKAAMDTRKMGERKKYDIECSIEDLMTEEYLDILNNFEPFGPGNMRPVFLDNKAKVIDSRKVGRGGEHLNITFQGKYANYKGIGFGLGLALENIQSKPLRSTLYTPTKNRFRGRESWQVRVIDI